MLDARAYGRMKDTKIRHVLRRNTPFQGKKFIGETHFNMTPCKNSLMPRTQ